MSEHMEPTQLQTLLTGVFSKLTSLIRANKGSIDKLHGRLCRWLLGALWKRKIMRIWQFVQQWKWRWPYEKLTKATESRVCQIGVGIGLNTGPMCVGDMGSKYSPLPTR